MTALKRDGSANTNSVAIMTCCEKRDAERKKVVNLESAGSSVKIDVPWIRVATIIFCSRSNEIVEGMKKGGVESVELVVDGGC